MKIAPGSLTRRKFIAAAATGTAAAIHAPLAFGAAPSVSRGEHAMQIVHSAQVEPASPSKQLEEHLKTISADQLRRWVEKIAVPRHFIAEADQNRAIGNWLLDELQGWGYEVRRQGPHSNIVALPKRSSFKELTLVGAHYDSVPGCPGADDNASAVAAMLGCAKACARWKRPLPVVFVAFNREEEGMIGSLEFVKDYLPAAGFKVKRAHILEMVGYASSDPGSQSVPSQLPIQLPDKGDFLGLLADKRSAAEMSAIISRSAGCNPSLPVIGLEVMAGMALVLPVLARSDHAPFWAGSIPAIMWTDTAEFRNPHYHQKTDTPVTLDYQFLEKVTRTLTASVMWESPED